MRHQIDAALSEAHEALEALQKNQAALDAIAAAAQLLAHRLRSGGHVYTCGNGGSMCDAMHCAEEFTGRFRRNRRPLPVAAISNPGHLTCTANDFGYDEVFSRYVDAHGREGDVLVTISTSGNSPNVLKAAQVARERGMAVIALLGRHDSPLETLATVSIVTPGGRFADRVQELHIKVIHILVELVEGELGLS